MATNLPSTGKIGLEPPPDAPREPSQPLQPEAGTIVVYDPVTKQPTGEVIRPADRARQHERQLAPLTYGRGPDDAPTTAAEIPPKPMSDLEAAARAAHEGRATGDGTDPVYPAGSASESPSRGLPRFIADPEKRLSGGFGEAVGEYSALDGAELRVLVEHLCATLEVAMDDDLRFTVATTYPKLGVRVQVVIDTEDPGQQIVLTAQRREFDEQDHPETPPDAMRDELKIPRPHKQMVATGAGPMFADVTW